MKHGFNLDFLFENATRYSAKRLGRRSFIARLGVMLVGAGSLVLPYARSSARAAESEGPTQDESDCAYWRYCALDGYLCSCCGGSPSTCPPGTTPSPVSWVGTCENPFDGRTYLISYNDCCGKISCDNCHCFNNVRERPPYSPGLTNDFNWCMANDSTSYHCTVALISGVNSEKN